MNAVIFGIKRRRIGTPVYLKSSASPTDQRPLKGEHNNAQKFGQKSAQGTRTRFKEVLGEASNAFTV